MNFEDDLGDEEETENANEKIKRKRGPNKEYVLVEEFEDKLKFDEYWNELDVKMLANMGLKNVKCNARLCFLAVT